MVRDGDVPLFAATLMRAEDTDQYEWARECVDAVRATLADYPQARLAVEGVSDPKGFKHGDRAALNPAYIMRAAIVVGGVVTAFPNVIVIAPGGNGSQHTSHYPPVLIGRHPDSLPGVTAAKTRAHEQSAYDVAGKARRIAWAAPTPDLRSLMSDASPITSRAGAP